MHDGYWGAQRLWEICERFGRFGKPVHFIEVSIVSGPEDPKMRCRVVDKGSPSDRGQDRNRAFSGVPGPVRCPSLGSRDDFRCEHMRARGRLREGAVEGVSFARELTRKRKMVRERTR
jgi:hypothetical protein